jgi:hypothetical protein
MNIIRRGLLVAWAINKPDLANQISDFLGCMVLDKTGLTEGTI